MVYPAKIVVIVNLEALTNVKKYHTTLGHTEYYRNFVKAYAPILVFPYWKKEFPVHVDISCIMLSAALTQLGKGHIDHPIAFASRKLSKVEKNYSTTNLSEGPKMVYVL